MIKKLSIVLIFITTFLCFSLIFINKTASADGEEEVVLRIEKDDVYFYSSNNLLEKDKLFLLTKTYFLTGIDCGDHYAVQYKKGTNAEISGFVKKSEVEIYNDGVPNLLYPVFKAETTRTYLPLYYNITTLENINGFLENLADCYGKITANGETYMLVYYEGQPPRRGIFYVNCADLEITEPAIHPIPLKIPEEPQENPNDGDNETPDNSDETWQIIIIIAVIVFAVAVVYFMFRPNNYKYKRKDNDEM